MDVNKTISKYIEGDKSVSIKQVSDAVNKVKGEWKGRAVTGKFQSVLNSIVNTIKNLFTDRTKENFKELSEHFVKEGKKVILWKGVNTEISNAKLKLENIDVSSVNLKDVEDRLARVRNVLILIGEKDRDKETIETGMKLIN